MDKRRLRKVPAVPAPDWMTKAAQEAKLRRNDLELWYASAEDLGGVVMLRIYERSKLIGGIAHGEAYRVFLDAGNRDYISWKAAEQPPKCWLEGRLASVLSWSDAGNEPYFEYEPGYVQRGLSPYLAFDREGEKVLEAALGPLEEGKTWGLMITKWQEEILGERLSERHDRELEPVAELMSRVPELPEGFFDWLCTDGIARFDYAIYTPPKGKKTTDIQCTRCGAEMKVDVRKVHPVKDRMGICPACGRPVTWKTASSRLDREVNFWSVREPWYVAVIQRMGAGLIVRYFYADVKFERSYGKVTGRECSYGEVARDVFPDADREHYERYERIRYKHRGPVRWAPGTGEYGVSNAFLYTENLPGELRGTAWQYSGIKEFQQREWPGRIPVSRFLFCYPELPFLEYFAKMGLARLTRDILRASWYYVDGHLNVKGRRPDEILKIPPQDVKLLAGLDGGSVTLEILQDAAACRVRLDAEELRHFERLFGAGGLGAGIFTDRLAPVRVGGTPIDIHRRLKYFRRQAEKHFDAEKWDRRFTKQEALLSFERSLWRDWDDYTGWLEELMPGCAGDPYYALPPDFPKAHDRLMAAEEERRKKEAEEKRRKMEEAVNRLLSEMHGQEGVLMSAAGLLVRIPKDAAEIRAEGEIQHHCVATYIDRVKKGETMILFVRKESDPDTPFYTMEWKDGHVAQCRGKRNADMTKDVKTFVMAFERRMQEDDEGGRIRQKVMVTA